MTAEILAADLMLSRFLTHAEAGLRRVSFDVLSEQVTFFVRQGRLRVQCTCGVEGCEHQKIAIGFLGAEAVGGTSPMQPDPPRTRSSVRPPAPLPPDAALLSASIEDLALAIARSGLDAADSPSIREALDQLVARTPRPSLTLSRWIGRLGEALAIGETGKLARLLHGAQNWASEMAGGAPSQATLSRARSWLGSADGTCLDTLADSTLVEVGREWLNGISRASIERRYLVDLHGGEVFCEERRRGDFDHSVGPCPRVAQVAFAEVDAAVQPPRLRLLQYTVSPEPTQDQWRQLSEFARNRVEDLAGYYATISRRVLGTSEPFVLFAPALHSLGHDASHLRDDQGAGVELGDDANGPLVDTLRAMAEDHEVVWVAGRLTGLARGLSLRPVSLLLKREGRYTLRRVT